MNVDTTETDRLEQEDLFVIGQLASLAKDGTSQFSSNQELRQTVLTLEQGVYNASQTIARLRGLLQECLEIVNADAAGLEEMGVDSSKIINLHERINAELGIVDGEPELSDADDEIPF